MPPAPYADPHVRTAAVGPSSAEYDSRFRELEERLASIEETAEDPSLVRVNSDKATLTIGGRLHLDYWAFPGDSTGINLIEADDPDISPQDRLEVRRARLSLKGDLPGNMEYAADLEYANGNEIGFRDLYLGWSELPVLRTLLIGNQKRPYGLDHLNSSNSNIFLERPFAVEAFNSDNRRLGICAYGISEDLTYNWRYGIFNMRNVQRDGLYTSDHYQGEVTGRLASTAWYDDTSDGRGYLHLAISGSVAHPDSTNLDPPDDVGRAESEADYDTRPEARTASRWIDTGEIPGAEWMQLVGLESVLNVGQFQLCGELLTSAVSRSDDFGGDLHFHGGYVYAAWMLTGEHMPWDRRRGTLGRVTPFENFFLVRTCDGGLGHGLGAWQVSTRYSYADLNDGDIFGGRGESLTFGLNWWWTSQARLQMNYIIGEIKDRDIDSGAGFDLVTGDYHIVGTRVMYFY